jgi:SAM-dependent methyltransferase
VHYDDTYEGTQIYSSHFREYLRDLGRQWIAARPELPASVLEVGCGQGEFLNVLASLMQTHLVGYDPAFRGSDTGSVTILAENLPATPHSKFDLVINRMTLEHLDEPFAFTQRQKAWMSEQGCLITQVPNAERMIAGKLPCDLVYEHVNYFTNGSLGALMRRAGFRHISTSLGYDTQHLTAIATDSGGDDADVPPAVAMDVDAFAASARAFPDEWQEKLTKFRDNNLRIWIWGAGSRATAFLCNLPDPGVVSGAIDINPNRDGTYVLGTSCRTYRPNVLRNRDDIAVVVMNPAYSEEVRSVLTEYHVTARILPMI